VSPPPSPGSRSITRTADLGAPVLIVTLPTVWFAIKEPKSLTLEAMDQLWDEPEKLTTVDSIHSIEMAKRRGFSSGGPGPSAGGASRV